MSTSRDQLDLSVVVPVRDEEENVPILVERLLRVIDEHEWSAEVVFVTDLNTDGTAEALRDQHRRDPRVKMLKLSSSHGQFVAAMAGLRSCRGAAIVLMDGDLQDCPEDIPRLYEKCRDGYDVVYAVKERKNDSALRNFYSRTFVKLINYLADQPSLISTSMFRIMSRRAVDALCKFDEQRPVISGLLGIIGYPTAAVTVTSGERAAGQTKYRFSRLVSLAIDFLLAFSTKPLRMISGLGLLVSILSFAYLVVVVAQWVFGTVDVIGWPTLVSLITLLGGMQLLALGVIGEYVGRIYMEAKRRPLYFVEEQVGDLP